MPTFVVEAYEPRGRDAGTLTGLEERARAAANEVSRSCSQVRYVRTTFLPEDETRVRWLRPEEELLVFDSMPQATKPTKRTSSRPLPFAAMARRAGEPSGTTKKMKAPKTSAKAPSRVRIISGHSAAA